MQKKHILVLSLLAFAIAMELIFILHLLGQSQGSQSSLSLSAKQPTLASTIALKIGQKKNAGPAPAGTIDPAATLEAGSVANDPAMNAYPAGPETLFPTLAEAPTAGEAAADVSPGLEDAYPSYYDEPFQEPADSEPGWSEPPPVEEMPVEEPPAEAPPVEQPPADEPQDPPLPEETQALPEPTAPAAPPTPAAPGKTPSPAQPTTAPSPKAPTPTAPAAAPALVSVHTGGAPKLDGSGDDAAWEAAPVTTLITRGGANHSATRVSIQSVYDEKRVYFLLTWADPSHSFLRNPWERQPDGSWKKLVDPQNQGNDENRYYEDQIALFWPIKEDPVDFAARGCGGACHAGENPDAKPYGNMYTPERGQIYDMWKWKSVRNVDQVDDQYLDSTHYSSDNPSAGFHSDPSKGGGFRNNQSQDKRAPAYMLPRGGDRTGAPGYILESEKKELDAELFKPGDRVPGILSEPFEGDRGDIAARWSYQNGAWTLEISRKLVTGSKYDVQFEDLRQTYAFALATFDNTQVRHAVQDMGTTFRFRQ